MLLSYLRRHVKIMILLASFIMIFAVVFSLYDLPMEAVLYAAVLCAVIGIVLFSVGYFRYQLQHRDLQKMRESIAYSLDGLPEAHGAIERDYQALISTLFREKARIATQADMDKREMIDYYTLWVHQIKTPIAAMGLLLQTQEASSPQNAALSAELFKIEQYVEMVLQYLRLGSDTTDFVIKTCALDDVVRQSVRKYARLFILKKLQLDFRESGLNVLSDEKWLSFVIDQVLGNALKYTVTGKVCIYTDGEALVIEDTGIGIRPEDLPRVFDKGFTGYNGREDKKSTGIGLYLSKRVIAMLGHSITMTSELGRGTRVRIGFDLHRLRGD